MANRTARIVDLTDTEPMAESYYVAPGCGDGVGRASIGNVAVVGDRCGFICVVLRAIGHGRRGVGSVGAARARVRRPAGRTDSKKSAADAYDARFLVRAGAEFGNNDLSRGGPHGASRGVLNDVPADHARA